MKQLVLPYFEELQQSRLNEKQRALVGIIQSNLQGIVAPFVRRLSAQYLSLTPMEIRVADLVKQGMANKQIAEMLGVSIHTVLTHRDNLRNKLGLRNKKVNLKSYLLSLG